MKLDEYQDEAIKLARFPKINIEWPDGQLERASFVYPALGLAGEAGEVLEHIKKIVRNDFGAISKERREKVKGELGDVLWYLARLAYEFDLSLETIAKENLKKLQQRDREGKIKER